MDELLTRTIDTVIDRTELETLMRGDRPLRIKLGVDPTSPDIHIGHAVIFRKLRQFQDLGHTVIFLIGDYTARIGDPSGRNKTRPVLSDDDIMTNAQTYLDQAGRILDMEKCEIRRNSEWLAELDFNALLRLASNFTVAQLIERDDFKNRLDSGVDLSLHELLYPVMQAYDSVMLESDIEFGGTDQLFNLLSGRSLQKKMGQPAQQVITQKLLVGLDGERKMSKSLGNYIALTDDPLDMYGKVMSIPDSLIGPYYELCTDIPLATIHQLMETLAAGANPRDTKASLAREIVTIYHSDTSAAEAETAWNSQFRDKEMPDAESLPPVKGFISKEKEHQMLSERIATAGIRDISSNSEARRLIAQGGVKINGEVVDKDGVVHLKDGDIISIGKRYHFRLESQ